MEEQVSYTIRRATDADEAAIRSIVEENPDEGEVTVAPRFRASPYEISKTITPDTTAFLAETEDGEPAGTGTVGFFSARVGGELHDCAYLNNLAVASGHRGEGLAKRLAERRISAAEQRGDEYVIWANIQQGNAPSKAVADSWADEFTYTTTTLALAPEANATRSNGYEIRTARRDELAAIADHVNDFYADAELFSPYTAENIAGRLDRTPVDTPIRQYLLAVDGDDIVAGADVIDVYKAMYMVVEGDGDVPPAFPDSGELRPRSISNPWFSDSHRAAAKAIIQHIQANPGDANRILLQSDPENPIASLLLDDLGATRTMQHMTAIRGPIETDDSRPIATPF